MEEQREKIIPDGGFFQSREWSSFQQFCGNTVWNIEESIFGIQKNLPFRLGKYAYVTRFPGKAFTQEQYKKLLSYAKNEKWIFIRIEPQTKNLLNDLQQGTTTVLSEAPSDIQPREIFMLDISKDEEVLLKAMKSKTRYNIRLASKQGVTIEKTRDPKEIEDFLDIMEKTAERKSIHFHSRTYYASFLEHFDQKVCELFVAKKDGVVLAGSLVCFYQETAYYLHGGSGDTGRNSMAPHLLQWSQIQEAKRRGCKQYDFGGVAIKSSVSKGKNWSGITRFKQGFGPETESLLFPGTYDLIINRMRYFLYRMFYSVKSFL